MKKTNYDALSEGRHNPFGYSASQFPAIITKVRTDISFAVLLPTFADEIHAELCYAECLLLRAVLTFVEDENLMSFVKGGLRMRSCLNAYKYVLYDLELEFTQNLVWLWPGSWTQITNYLVILCRECWNILRQKNWADCKHKPHFESGVRMGVGAYNLVRTLTFWESAHFKTCCILYDLFYYFSANFYAATKNYETFRIHRIFWQSSKSSVHK